MPNAEFAELFRQFVEDAVGIEEKVIPFSQRSTVFPCKTSLEAAGKVAGEAAGKVAGSEEKPDNAAVIGGNGSGSTLVTSHQDGLHTTIRHTLVDSNQASALQEAQVPIFQTEVNPPV